MSAAHPPPAARPGVGSRLRDFEMHAIVTWNAPSNLHELANDETHDGRGLGVPFFVELATHQYDMAPSGVRCHLVVHGDADLVVPVDHGTVLHSRAAEPCDIVVIPANTPHRFVNSGDTVLHQIDIHASPRFIQTNLT